MAFLFIRQDNTKTGHHQWTDTEAEVGNKDDLTDTSCGLSRFREGTAWFLHKRLQVREGRLPTDRQHFGLMIKQNGSVQESSLQEEGYSLRGGGLYLCDGDKW